jgi:hypothetical protein
MKMKIVILAMLLGTMFFWLPSGGDSVSAQNRQNRSDRQNKRDHGRKNTHGYKNYGQYRRTQVGKNRRYRTTKRWYTHNGVRTSRTVRIYY